MIYFELKNKPVNPFTIHCHNRDLEIRVLVWWGFVLLKLQTANHCFEAGLTMVYCIFSWKFF